MSISPFFLELRSAYQSEMDDLRFDSEGRDVLSQRLAAKRGELGFLVQMMEISPEMVAVIFHQGFAFKSPAAMDQMLGLGRDDFPDWGSLAEGIEFAPWAKDLARVILQAPGGAWFLTVAAGLEYMAGRPASGAEQQSAGDEDDEEDGDKDGADDGQAVFDGDDEGEGDGDARARQEAGADWLVEQGFDRKD